MAVIKKELRKRNIEIAFPTAGLNRKGAYHQQKPFTTPDCLNVRALDALENRERGGSRPGLIYSHIDTLSSQVVMLSPMSVNLGDGFTSFSDTFGGLSLSSEWTQASWSSSLPYMLPSLESVAISTSIHDASIVLSSLAIDNTKTYTVEALLVPWGGAWFGSYRLYMRLDDTAPAITTDGVVVELIMTGSDGLYAGTIKSYLAGAETSTALTSGTVGSALSGWLSATISANVVTVFWNGTQIGTATVGAQTGKRTGMGLTCTQDDGACVVSVFRIQYYSKTEVNQLHSLLTASAGGNLYYEHPYGRMNALSTGLTLQSDVPMTACQEGQQLYIADYGNPVERGTDGTVSGASLTAASISNWGTKVTNPLDLVVVISDVQGTATAGTYTIASVGTTTLTLGSSAGSGACSYRIERAPKVYDPTLNTLVLMTATTGETPSGCPLICRFLDRIVLAGAAIAPHVWYMSRVGSPLDWDYGQEDTAKAVAGTSSEAGVPGDPITAIIPHSDDYLVIACRNSLWKITGDPANGGSLVNLSHSIGIVGQKAWCQAPDGSLIFLSMDGVYLLDAAGDAYPVAVSRENLPKEFISLNPDSLIICMEYDVRSGGVHVFMTPKYASSSTHWWIDTGLDTSKVSGVMVTAWRRSFWPFTLKSDHEPIAICSLQATAVEDAGVIIGGRDGRLRRFYDLAESDCGTAFSSYVVIGPIGLATDAMVGTVEFIDAVLAETSGPVTWELCPAITFEQSIAAAYQDTGTWYSGYNHTVHASARGQAVTLKLSGQAYRKWSSEQITATIREGGKRRIL